MEKRFGGHVIQIGQDKARDRSITSRDEPRVPEMGLSTMDMTCPKYSKIRNIRFISIELFNVCLLFRTMH